MSRRLLPWAAVLLAGCLEFPTERPCRDNADCDAEKACRAGLCEARGPRPMRDALVTADAGVLDARVPDAVAPDAAPGACGPLRLGRDPACAACLERTEGTCQSLRDCGADATCAAAWRCAEGCADPRCIADCKAPPGAEILGVTLQTYIFRACSAACDLGTSWACVDAFAWGGASSRVLDLGLAVLRVPMSVPYGGATVRACDLLDPACERPLGETTSTDEGLATLSVDVGVDPLGFTGFFTIEDDVLMPTIVVPAARLVTDGAFLQPVVGAVEARLTIRLATGHDPTPGNATMLVQVRDCHDYPAPDVVVDITAGADGHRAVYFNDNLPDPELTATDPSGLAGFVDVPISPEGATVTVTARRAGDGAVVARRQALLRPDRLTFVHMGPDGRD